jgi:hypothetical protein
MDMREKIRDWKIFWDLQSEAEYVLIRFGIVIKFIKLVENPLHTRPYNFEKANWPRFRNRFKQFVTPVLALYYSKNS